jgi:hypothetical protein
MTDKVTAGGVVKEANSTGPKFGHHPECSIVHTTSALVELDVLRMDDS